MYVCIFTKLHITAQSGPVIRVILCHSHDPPKGGSMILVTKTSDMYVCMYKCVYGHIIYQSMDQPGKVANPTRGQLNKENEHFPVPVRA